jgi:hypothetical protein
MISRGTDRLGKRRLARWVALAGALTLAGAAAFAGCGGDGSTTASSGPPVPGSYVGETSQGLPITFEVAPGAVGTLRFGWRATCDDGQVHQNTIVLPGSRLHYGVFAMGGTLETGGIAHVSGKIEGSEASGSLSRSHGSAFGTNCRATGIAWHAQMEAGSGSEGAAA